MRTIDKNLKKSEETVNRIEKGKYVDDLVTGENTLDELRNVKKESVVQFQKGGFISISEILMCQLWRAIT